MKIIKELKKDNLFKNKISKRSAFFGIARAALSVMCALLAMFTFAFSAVAQERIKANRGSAISPTVIIIGSEQDAEQTYSYNQNSPGFDKSHRGIVIPVTVKEPGSVKISFSGLGLERSVSVYMYTDPACTKRIANNMYVTTDSPICDTYYTVEAAGTYYLYCSTYVGSGFGGNFENRFKISSALYPSGIKQLPDGVRIVYYRTNPRQKHLFKYVAPKTGEVTVYLPYIDGGFVKMLNASQKPISHLEQVSAYSDDGLKQEFYVQKGKTYFFEVTANGASDQLQNIKASVRPLRFKQIRNKKSSAIKVKKRRLIKGMFANGGKSDAWYKIKALADEKLKITASCKPIGGLRLCVYDQNGKNAANKKCVQIKDGTAVNIKAQKGKKTFYYIKISKNDRYSSGRFAFKVRTEK